MTSTVAVSKNILEIAQKVVTASGAKRVILLVP
jgi:hypothetical protein